DTRVFTPFPYPTLFRSDRDLIMAAIGVVLPLHRVHVGNRREVEIFAPNEGRKPGEQRLPGRDVARARPRFDQRGALPILSAAFRSEEHTSELQSPDHLV